MIKERVKTSFETNFAQSLGRKHLKQMLQPASRLSCWSHRPAYSPQQQHVM